MKKGSMKQIFYKVVTAAKYALNAVLSLALLLNLRKGQGMAQ